MFKITPHDPYLIAEIGWNFLGNLDLAKKMIIAAKESGADGVKFQVWNPKYLKKGAWDDDGRKEIYKKAQLNLEKFNDLYQFSINQKIDCFTSVFTTRDLNEVVKVSNNIIKIPSHEAYNIELIEEALDKFNVVILSAGCLKKNELDNLKKYKDEKKLIVLHCVSSYPLLAKNCNFSKFHYLKKIFKNVGYSGHYDGIDDGIYAIINQACIVEKHFTTDNNLEGRDNKFALNPKEFKKLSDWKKINKEFLIDNGLDLQDCEFDIFKNYRGRWDKK